MFITKELEIDGIKLFHTFEPPKLNWEVEITPYSKPYKLPNIRASRTSTNEMIKT